MWYEFDPMKRFSCCIQYACLGFLTLLLASCGGGGGGGGGAVSTTVGESGTGGTGTVALLATDAPTAEFAEINLTIIEAELLGQDGRVTVFSGEKEFDLLTLTEVTEVFAVGEAPEGAYSKIRLTLTQIELVFKDGRDPVYPRLPGNGKLDLNPRETFYVDADKPLVIQLDFDAAKSIHVVKAGNSGRYNFRPVVFVDIAEGAFDTKLIRQRGTVNAIDLGDGTFKLCLIEAEIQPVPDTTDELPDCIDIDTTTAPASIFDDFADPADLDDLEIGDILTVVGRFAFRDNDGDVTTFNNGNGNGNGNGKSNGKGNNKNDGPGEPDNSSNDDDFEEADPDESDTAIALDNGDRLILVAEVIWRGDDITQTDNVACTGVMQNDGQVWYDNLELFLPGDPECDDGESRPTILQPGARIYDADGNPLSEASITEGTFNTVDGYLDTEAAPSELKAVLVMLTDEESVDETDQLTGIIGDIDAGESLILMTEEGDRCVSFSASGTEVFETRVDADGNVEFSRENVDALASGQLANAFGELNGDGCLKAHTIIYETEASIQPL